MKYHLTLIHLDSGIRQTIGKVLVNLLSLLKTTGLPVSLPILGILLPKGCQRTELCPLQLERELS